MDTEHATVASGRLLEENRELVDFEHGRFGSLVEEWIEVRNEVLRTLHIEDWGLFGEEDGERKYEPN